MNSPFHLLRLYFLLILLSLLASAVVLAISEPVNRHSRLADTAQAEPSVRILLAFRTDRDSDFQSLPLRERANIKQRVQRQVMRDAGIRQPTVRDFKYSRGVVLDISARQLHRLSRQKRVWAIEPNHSARYEALGDPPQAPKYWATPEAVHHGTNKAVKVAMIDSGLQTLPDSGRLQFTDAACFCSRGDNGCCPADSVTQFRSDSTVDEHGHGTAVASILTDSMRRYSSGPINLVVTKIIDDYPGICCPADIAAAFDWLAASHPDLDVVNASLSVGGSRHSFCNDGWGTDRVVADAVSAVAQNGTLIVAASGNDADPARILPPGCVSGVITVGGVYDQDYPSDYHPGAGCTDEVQQVNQVACFSNAGRALDILAPAAYLSAPWLNGTRRDQDLRGTSFAAPQVAGCVAAIRAEFPALSSDSVRDALLNSGKPVTDHRNDTTWPLLDCQAAMDAARLLQLRQ